MAASIRVGCIGCGGHAVAYLQPCLAISESFELAAVCDLDGAKAEQSARRYGWQRWYSNWHTMLEQEQLDAVVVCAPPAVHEEAGLAILQRGLHLFSEKPTSMTAAGAKRLADAAANTSRVHMVGLMWRHMPAHRMAGECMQRSEFGRPLLFQGRYFAPGHGIRRDWGLTDDQEQRYFLLDHAIHIIDCMHALMGKVASVHAVALPDRSGAQAMQVTLTFTSGALGTLTMAHRTPVFDALVLVLGDGPAHVQVRNWHTLEYMPPKPAIGRGGYADHPALVWNSGIGYMEGLGRPGYREELELFAQAIREGGKGHADLEDAWQAMLVIDAIEESLRQGSGVTLAVST
jgi:predicted dehydrogenase